MAEIMLKSKLAKADKAKEARDQLALLDQLDTDVKGDHHTHTHTNAPHTHSLSPPPPPRPRNKPDPTVPQ